MANVACYAIQMIWPQFTQMGVKLSDKILRGEELYRLLTPVFLHGGIAHLCMNMFSLRNVGPDVEKLFGPGRYLSTYLLAGIAGNLASAYNSPRPALGASGAVFGIVGAQLVFLSRNDWLLGRQGENMQTALMSTILINVGIGMMNPMVDNWGHAGKERRQCHGMKITVAFGDDTDDCLSLFICEKQADSLEEVQQLTTLVRVFSYWKCLKEGVV